MDKKIKDLLSERYVCVYVDTEQAEGRRLAREFEMPDGLGIVISDSAGKLQAFRHEGDLSNRKLADYLRRYSDPERVVRVTESNPGEEERAAQVEPVNIGRSSFPGLIAPAPTFFPSFAGGGGRGC